MSIQTRDSENGMHVNNEIESMLVLVMYNKVMRG